MTKSPPVEKKYKTIVVDPPWPIVAPAKFAGYEGKRRLEDKTLPKSQMPYKTMSVDEIRSLPIKKIIDDNSVLFLWTTNQFLRETYAVMESWGFKPSTLLVWAKTPCGIGLGGAFTITTEYILYGRHGSLKPKQRLNTSWFNWKRNYEGGYKKHSKKPEGLNDLAEQMFDGPYIELFARRARLGWDVWGNEVKSDIEL